MAEITKLRKQRGTIKAKLTRLTTKVQQIEEVNREEIEVYIARLEEIQKEFESVQCEISSITEGEPTVADATDDAEFEEKYIQTKIKLKRWLNKLPTQQVESRSSSSDEALARVLQQQGELMQQLSQQQGGWQASGSSGDAIAKLFEQQAQLMRSLTDANDIANQESRVKWPEIKLPTFDGRVEDWKRYSETFISMIHSKEKMSNIQKHQYLVASLSGDAARLLNPSR